MEREIDRLFRQLAGSFFGPEMSRDGTGTMPGSACGFTLSVGADGRPVLQEYCNTAEPTQTDGVREPLVDTITNDKEGTTKLVAEMPGVERNDINVTVENRHVNIVADHGDKKYRARVPIAQRVKEDSTKASYKNGVLEVTFQLLGEPKPKGKKVEVQ